MQLVAAGLMILGGCVVGYDVPGEEVYDGPEWSVRDSPSWRIGMGTLGPDLFAVRAARLLSDGRVAFIDGRFDSRLVIVDPGSGETVVAAGPGEGPGELGWATELQVGPNDSIYVFDYSLQRLTAFDAQGVFARSATFRGEPPVALDRLLRLNDSVWIGVEKEELLQGAPGNVLQDTVVVGAVSAALDDWQQWAMHPGLMTVTMLHQGQLRWSQVIFTPRVTVAGGADCVYVAGTSEDSIAVYGLQGKTSGAIPAPGKERVVSEGDLESRHRELASRFPDSNPLSLERRIYGWPRPATLPRFASLVVDWDGRLWVQEYRSPLGPGPHWRVLAPDGKSLAVASIPVSRVQEIRPEGVLVIRRTELDVELIELLPWSQRPSVSEGGGSRCAEDGGRSSRTALEGD